jgi:hypothetical protein
MPGKESAVILASSASTCHAYASLDIAPARPDFDVMTEIDIDKAMSEFELVGNRRNAWDMMFRDPKTRKFWEIVYPAEGGPRQLRPITSHEARIQYSGAFSGRQTKVHDYWLDGEILTAVTFGLDHWRLEFGASTVTPLTSIEIHSNGVAVRNGDDQFRNRLCELIGKVVERLELREATACTIAFEDNTSITISLRPTDYRGPEALQLSSSGQMLMVI